MSGSLPISGVVLTPRSMGGRPSAMICQVPATIRACLASVRPMGSGTDVAPETTGMGLELGSMGTDLESGFSGTNKWWAG